MSSADVVYPASAAAPAIFRLPPPAPTKKPAPTKERAPPKPSNPFLQLALCLSLAPFLFFFAGKVLLHLLSSDAAAASVDTLRLPGGLLAIAVAFAAWVWRGR